LNRIFVISRQQDDTFKIALEGIVYFLRPIPFIRKEKTHPSQGQKRKGKCTKRANSSTGGKLDSTFLKELENIIRICVNSLAITCEK
jgi:hypothetical protein